MLPSEPSPRPSDSINIDNEEALLPDPVTTAQQIVQVSTFIRSEFCTLTLTRLYPEFHKRLRDTATQLMAYPWVLVDEHNLSKPFHRRADLQISPTQAIAAMEDLSRFFERRSESARVHRGADVETALARDLLFAANFTRALCTPPRSLGQYHDRDLGLSSERQIKGSHTPPPAHSSSRLLDNLHPYTIHDALLADAGNDDASSTAATAGSDTAARIQDARDDWEHMARYISDPAHYHERILSSSEGACVEKGGSV